MASQPETFTMTSRLSTRSDIDRLKAAAAQAAVEMVEDGNPMSAAWLHRTRRVAARDRRRERRR